MTSTSNPNLSLIARNTPACLRDRRQWVAWKLIERDGKLTKAPVNPASGDLADSTDPATWGAFQQAIETCRHDESLAGVGFVFTPDDPYCGVDLDNCVDPTSGVVKAWAADIVAQLGSYTETSPSGTGLKVFLKAKKRGLRCRTAYQDGEVEIYDRDRFFTVTGMRLDQSPGDTEAGQEALDQLYHRLFGMEDGDCSWNGATHSRHEPSTNGHIHLADETILTLASTQRRSGGKFQTLWGGDWNAHFNSPSEADSSVVFTLAYYTKDAAQIDRLFRHSALMRAKWDERHGEQTYGELTIAKALSKVTRQYEPRIKRNRFRPAAPPPTRSDIPSIVVADTQLSDLTDQALDALIQANTPPTVFVRAGTVVRTVGDEKGIPKIEPFDRARMRCRLSEVANFFTLRKGADGYVQVGTHPPLSLAENVLAQTTWNLPPLAGIARAPILRCDGTICTQPGYDPVSRLRYCPDPELSLTPIPEYPDCNEVQACIDIILGLISDFPFADEPSRANALAILFTLLMRPVITGHVPLAIVDAPVQGTGKTLLVTALGTIAVGQVSSESIPSKRNDDEWRKKITSLLLAASPFVLLDNVPDNTTIDSPALAAALTSREWSDRLLGRNDSIHLPSRAVWVATGNNLRVAGDMPRRSYGIRLDANAERPWERTGFKIKALERYVLSHRGDLLSAALTVIRAWYTNGKPQASVPVLGSFEEWAATIGSVLAFIGVEGFLGNLEQTQVVQDEDTQQWTAFFDAWWDHFGGDDIAADDLCRLILPPGGRYDEAPDGAFLEALPEALLVNKDRGEGSLKRSIGRNLSRLAGRIFNGRKLTDAAANKHKHVRKWKLDALTSGHRDAATGGAR